MNNIDTLVNFFKNEIKPNLEDLEAWRKKVLKKSIIIDAIFAPPFIAATILLVRYMILNIIEKNMDFANAAFMVFMVGFLSQLLFIPYCVAWRILRYNSKAIKTADGKEISLNRNNELLYKNLVMGKIVKFISPDLKYSPERRELSGEDVLKGEIFPHTIFYPQAYIAEDFVEGTIGNTHVRFFEISGKDVVKPMVRTSRGWAVDLNGFPWEKFSFHGMLGAVDFNKSFKGHTLVLPRARARKSEWMRGSGRERIRLEDPEFERYFSVFGTDQVIARYILSTALMKRITDYRKKSVEKYISRLPGINSMSP